MSIIENSDKNKFCYIIDKNNNKNIGSLSFESECDCGFVDVELKPTLKFQLCPKPITETERMTLFIAGESGSGKSYFIREYVKLYNKMFPKNPIYLISYLEQDDTLDEFKKIIRLDCMSVDFLEECMSNDFFKDLKDSFVIFDDVDSIANKNTKKKIYDLLHKILRLGRHEGISCAICTHELYAEHNLKLILNEVSNITFFPKRLNYKKMKYLLEVYFGLSKEQIQKIRAIKDRSITYIKEESKIILSESTCFLL